jgi:hypothetical protein
MCTPDGRKRMLQKLYFRTLRHIAKGIVINFFVTRIRSHNDLDKIRHVTHHHTVMKRRMSGAISLIHPYAFMASTRATVTFQC